MKFKLIISPKIEKIMHLKYHQNRRIGLVKENVYQ